MGRTARTVAFLRVLLLASVVRNICLPYATMLVATGRQNVAVAGATAEAVVNVTCSILLAHRIGAMGVAYGTLIGSFVTWECISGSACITPTGPFR